MKAVSPWLELQTIPFAIKPARTGPNDVAALLNGENGGQGKMGVRYKLPLSEMVSMGCGGYEAGDGICFIATL